MTDIPTFQEVDDDVMSEGEEGDETAVFQLMHESVDVLEERFNEFVKNPTADCHKEFNNVVAEFISLARELKNMAKAVLPASEKIAKPRGKKVTSTDESAVPNIIEQTIIQAVNDAPQIQAVQDNPTAKKRAGRKPKQPIA